MVGTSRQVNDPAAQESGAQENIEPGGSQPSEEDHCIFIRSLAQAECCNEIFQQPASHAEASALYRPVETAGDVFHRNECGLKLP